MGPGFGRPFAQHGGWTEAGFSRFLSNGSDCPTDREEYEGIIDRSPDARHKKMMREGELLMKDPAVVKKVPRKPVRLRCEGELYRVQPPVPG